MRKQSGFTLIELMIVIAILGILMAIAIPAYSDYTIRAKVSEGINLAAGAKMGVSEYRLSEGQQPATQSNAGLADVIDSNFVEKLIVLDGIIRITYRNIDAVVDGSILVLTPTMNSGKSALNWTCGGAVGDSFGQNISNRYVPSSCRT